MLVLSRKIGERIVLQVPGQPDITIVLKDVDRGKCRLGIQADRSVSIMREELLTATEREAAR